MHPEPKGAPAPGVGRALPPPGAQAARVERRGLADTDLSLPGLTFTRNRPYTGRWSDVLIPGQDEYLSGQMSPLWRLLYRTRSCGETAGARTPAPGLLCVQPRLALRLGPMPSVPQASPTPLPGVQARCRGPPHCPQATLVPPVPWAWAEAPGSSWHPPPVACPPPAAEAGPGRCHPAHWLTSKRL